MKALFANQLLTTGIAILLLILVVALGGAFLSTYDPYALNPL